MCTAISFLSGHHYFGRNLDLEYHYSESVTITPRNYAFNFRATAPAKHHNAMIGIAAIVDGYPLYYDAVNEHGLGIAALNFPGNAVYHSIDNQKINISAFEVIPYLLNICSTVAEAKQALKKINIVNIPFNNELPITPLHWFVADRSEAIVIEQTANGLQVFDNPVKVLTNNPPFPYHMLNLSNYLNLSPEDPRNQFASKMDLPLYSRGLGAFGLPGDLSSTSRFVRAAFVLHNSPNFADQENSITQYFHILGSVEQQKGCVKVGDLLEETVYTSCCDADLGIYYYTTYRNHQITAVDMHRHQLNSSKLISYPLQFRQNIKWV